MKLYLPNANHSMPIPKCQILPLLQWTENGKYGAILALETKTIMLF